METILALIEAYVTRSVATNWIRSNPLDRFVHQHDEEFNALKKERRAGRPASTREDLLRMKITADEKEHENGFCELL